MDKLGIQLPLLLAQVANFAILVFILTKFLYKPVLKKLEERRQKITKGIALTDELKLKEEEAAKKETEIIKAAKLEAARIIAAAKKEAAAHKQEIQNQAQTEVSRDRAKLTEEMTATLAASQAALSAQTINIASAMAGRIVADVLDSKAQHTLIDQAIAKLENSHVRK